MVDIFVLVSAGQSSYVGLVELLVLGGLLSSVLAGILHLNFFFFNDRGTLFHLVFDSGHVVAGAANGWRRVQNLRIVVQVLYIWITFDSG